MTTTGISRAGFPPSVERALSLLSRQCLAGQIPNVFPLQSEAGVWASKRNAGATTSWQFTTEDQWVNLKSD